MYQKLFIFIVLLFLSFCTNTKEQNKIKFSTPELLNILSPEDAIIYLGDREIDQTLTPYCGTATPTTSMGTTIPGQTTPTPQPTTGTSGSGTRFTIFSQLVMKYTKEVLTLKFLYDMNQYQGNIDPQMGFILTGKLFGRTITGTQGTVKWYNQGIGYINTTGSTGVQTLSFFILDINLTGTYTDSVSSTTQPVQCPTLDGINCTSAPTNGRTCLTTNNLVCAVSTNTTGTPVTIVGKLKCSAKNIIPN